MDENDKVFVFCLTVLRWSGLSFTAVESSSTGEFVSSHSSFHLFFNLIIASVFLFLYSQISLTACTVSEKVYKASSILYPFYTKMVALIIVVFSLCGNVYNRKFIGIINCFRRVIRKLRRETGDSSRGRGGRRSGVRVLVQLFLYWGVLSGLNLYADGHIVFHFGMTLRLIQYVCFYYVALFTAHFLVTMNCIREGFEYVNGAFGRVVHPRLAGPFPASEGRFSGGKKLGVCMEAFMELREVEALVNEVFGKQIFLSMMLVFSAVIVNIYYITSLNLYGTSNFWLNMSMFLGFFQSVVMALLSTRAAELAVCEVNRANEILFGIPIDWNDRKIYNQINYFALFNYNHPMEFKAWVFYALKYDSLFRVILTSSVITTVILQCDFLRKTPT